jgi:hypothetical protein
MKVSEKMSFLGLFLRLGIMGLALLKKSWLYRDPMPFFMEQSAILKAGSRTDSSWWRRIPAIPFYPSWPPKTAKVMAIARKP